MTGEQMRLARINNGHSIRGLARDLQVPEQSIRRIEKGLGISLSYAKRIADYHGVQVTDILPVCKLDAAAA